jgi:hypothetical protein
LKVRVGVASAVFCLTLLTYFQFPGHTYLQQDTQIYAPILEHLWDPSVLNQDILVQRPHVAFTLYDELALGLRRATGAGFHAILAGLQITTRGLGLWGIYLIATAILNNRRWALLVMAVVGLGGAIDGPAVLITEYEPSPRAFAIPLVFLAIGLMAWRRPVWAGTVAAIGFVLHPPSVLAFWVVYFLVERKLRAWAPFAIAVAVLLLAASAQPGVNEGQPFFFRITPELERLQRMRASYNWVSMWWSAEWWKHLLAALVVGAGFWKIRKLCPSGATAFLVGLPIFGMLSVPLSYLLLEKLKWGLIPQVQPARTLLFVTGMAVLLAAICGCMAVKRQAWMEAGGWFLIAVGPPLTWNHWWLAAILAGLLVAAGRYGWMSAPGAIAGYFAIPLLAHVVNYPTVHTPELRGIAAWAAQSTPKDAVFVFPRAGKRPDAGVFRSEALRAIYVDWKGGGQVNYLPQLGEEWWARWQDIMLQPVDWEKYGARGIDYAVVAAGEPIAGRQPAFQNERYLVYSVTAKSP